MSVCVCVCLWVQSRNTHNIDLQWHNFQKKTLILRLRTPLPKTLTSWCHEDFWSKNVFLILACENTILKKCISFPKIFKTHSFGPPHQKKSFCPPQKSIKIVFRPPTEKEEEKKCWTPPKKLVFWKRPKKNYQYTHGICATICIGRDIQCLPYISWLELTPRFCSTRHSKE